MCFQWLRRLAVSFEYTLVFNAEKYLYSNEATEAGRDTPNLHFSFTGKNWLENQLLNALVVVTIRIETGSHVKEDYPLNENRRMTQTSSTQWRDKQTKKVCITMHTWHDQ